MKKICVISEGFVGTSANMANALADKDHMVDFIMLMGVSDDIRNMESIEINDNVKLCICKSLSQNNIKGIQTLENSKYIKYYLSRIPHRDDGFSGQVSPLFRRILVHKLLSRYYDVAIVIGQSWFMQKVSLSLKRHGVLTLRNFHEIFDRMASNSLYGYIESAIKNKLTVVVHSPFVYDQLARIYPNNISNIHFIPFGLYNTYLSYGEDEKIKKTIPKENYFLAYGYMQEYKGYSLIWDAVEYLEAIKKDNIKIVVAGGGALPVLEKMKKDSHFTVINRWLRNSELVTLIRHSCGILCPYKTASQSGIPQTAFGFGKPVIATNVGAFPEIINHDNGILIDYDKKQLADAMEDMMHRTFKMEVSDIFSWASIKRQYYSLIGF